MAVGTGGGYFATTTPQKNKEFKYNDIEISIK